MTDLSHLTTISDLTLTEGEVRYVLRNLDEEKATGPDKIPAVLLKNCAASIAPSLCELFNKSLSSGQLILYLMFIETLLQYIYTELTSPKYY